MQIEIVSVGADIYGPIESAIRTLNAIQDEFVFRTAPESLRADAIEFVREKYESDELFDYLKEYRKRRGGGESTNRLRQRSNGYCVQHCIFA